MTEYLP